MQNMYPIKVIVADDHALYRAGIIAALSGNKDISIVAEAANGLLLLDTLSNVVADVILLDIQMPIADGITVLPQIKKQYGHIKIIMLTLAEEYNIIVKVMQLGANSFLTKNSDIEIIYNAIITCHQQEYSYNTILKKVFPTVADFNNFVASKKKE